MVCVVSPKNIVPERGEGLRCHHRRRRRRPGPTTPPMGKRSTTFPGNSDEDAGAGAADDATDGGVRPPLFRPVRTIWNHFRLRRRRSRHRRRPITATTTIISVLPRVGYFYFVLRCCCDCSRTKAGYYSATGAVVVLRSITWSCSSQEPTDPLRRI